MLTGTTKSKKYINSENSSRRDEFSEGGEGDLSSDYEREKPSRRDEISELRPAKHRKEREQALRAFSWRYWFK